MCKFAVGLMNSSTFGLFHQNIPQSIQYMSDSTFTYNNAANYVLAKNYEHIKDMKNAINFYSFAAANGCDKSQFELGILYLKGKYIEQNIKMALYYFEMSSKKGNIKANFAMGYFYLVGTEFCDINISKSIEYFKNASYLDAYSKNNLGMIYKYGLGDPKQTNIFCARTYFEEAYDKSFDPIIAYNLAHVYIYYEKFFSEEHEDLIQKAIEVLNFSSFSKYPQIIDLLSIALILKYKDSLLTTERNICCDELQKLINDKIISEGLLIGQSNFKNKYEEIKQIAYLIDFPSEKAVLISNYYDVNLLIRSLKPQNKNNTEQYPKQYPIDQDFYDGFNG